MATLQTHIARNSDAWAKYYQSRAPHLAPLPSPYLNRTDQQLVRTEICVNGGLGSGGDPYNKSVNGGDGSSEDSTHIGVNTANNAGGCGTNRDDKNATGGYKNDDGSRTTGRDLDGGGGAGEDGVSAVGSVLAMSILLCLRPDVLPLAVQDFISQVSSCSLLQKCSMWVIIRLYT